MRWSAKAHFEDAASNIAKLLIRSEQALPAEWLVEYRKAARGAAPGVIAAPRKTGALRRSIITQQIGNRAQVSWRAPYAVAQNEGGHTVNKPIRGINPNTGKGSTIMPGYYQYRTYTTPGTGPKFAQAAFQYANNQIPAILRRQGIKK